MIRPSLTVVLAMTAFSNRSTDLVNVTPDTVTRFAFDKANDCTQVQISNQTGPQNDGMVEVIDAIYTDTINVTGIDCAIVVRLQTTDLDDAAIQAIGTALESYMDKNGASQFATAAIHDIGQGQQLFGHWNTMVFTRDNGGKWSAKNLGFTSVQKSTDGNYGVLLDGKLANVDGGSIVSTLLDSTKLQALIDGGYQLAGDKKKHLVRAPLQTGAYAVVDETGQTIYDDQFKVIAAAMTGFTVMPAIDVDGTPTPGKVTTVSGKGNTWDIRTSIPANKAGNLAQAYGAATA